MHHRLDGHESEQTLGDSEGQGGLVCCSPWGHTQSDTTEQQHVNYVKCLCRTQQHVDYVDCISFLKLG